VHPAPKLVIGITIDQLRTDYLEAFSALYGDQGFKKLWREARIYTNAGYSFLEMDRASAIASIYTGATPSLHGIISEKWMDAVTSRLTGCVDDPSFMGNYTSRSTSPAKLLVSTLADELKSGTQGKALVYSIAPTADAAIFGAGHAGDAAIWLNEADGKWCSTTYYKDFPWWASRYNDQRRMESRVSQLVWAPSYPSFRYDFAAGWRKEPFSYKFEGYEKYKRLAASPFINDEINYLLEELLNQSGAGEDETTDLVSLTYYAGNYEHRNIQESPMELQDSYVRLDRSIEKLLSLVERKIGLDKVLLFITSTGYVDPDQSVAPQYRIPGGEFYLNRCTALLNMYLMATYGDGQYVEAFYDNHIYLNHSLIERKQLDLAAIQEKAANFLVQFSGVNEVYPAYRLLLGPWGTETEKMRNGVHRKRSGDLIISLLPGWTVVNENASENQVIRYAALPVSVLFMGYGIKPETLATPIQVEQIAPTVSRIMRIRSPNGSSLLPLSGVR
jgi:hypothetical protein